MQVTLLETFGSDKMVVDCARVSFAKKAENFTEAQNDRLINYLAKHKHIAPFFHPKIQFRLQIPIYVERQLIKTQVGVEYNSVSGRYVDFSDSYTKIEDWRMQSKDSKQGSDESLDSREQIECAEIEDKIISICKSYYERLIELGVSKEQARTILPLSLNTEMIWTGSLYAFIRLCHLRLKDDAQKETRTVVQEMLNQVKELGKFNQSLNAFNIL